MKYEQSPLVQSSAELWQKATHANFLDAIADGSLPSDVFQRWLEQDYHFAVGLSSFQSLVAAKTPRPSQKLVIDGLKAMDAEMDWFEANANDRGYKLNTLIHPICRGYIDYLIAAAYTKPYEVLLGILFGVEVSYLAAWIALKPEGPYAEFIERWSNENFVEYVEGLQELADDNFHTEQQENFNQVLRFEHEFWQMTWEG